ncbi:hypothetical protein [Alkalicoccus luteus]|uniref:hypothetical protein n=1 Tax=Alkalicoccus luteus TaxID=1237094 RepID=UPI001439CF43|nr:hypothetical protein [Alkalicoccus luteus]
MPFADLNGTESLDCAESTGVPAGHIEETALLVGKQRRDRQTRLLFCSNGEFHDVLGCLFNFETSHNNTLHLNLISSCQSDPGI